MIVEFSDTGALYVYNETHQKVKTVANAHKGIISTNDLKIPSMNGLVEKNYWGVYIMRKGVWLISATGRNVWTVG